MTKCINANNTLVNQVINIYSFVYVTSNGKDECYAIIA